MTGYDPRPWYSLDEANAYGDGYRDAEEAAARAAGMPREGERFDRSWSHYADDCPVPPAARATGIDAQRLALILGAAEGDGIIGPDYTPEALAEYIVDALAAEKEAEHE